MVTNVFFPDIGGISTYVANLEESLRSRYVTRVFSYPSALAQIESRRPPRIFRLLLHFSFVAYVLAFVVASRLRGKQVLVHSHSAAFCLLVGFVGKALGTGAIHTFHSPLVTRSRTLAALVPFLDAAVFVSPSLRAEYHDRSGAKNAREAIIPGAISLSLNTQEARRMARGTVGHRLGLQPTTSIVLFVGRIVPEKGVHTLVQALAKVARPDIAVLIVGPPGSRAEDHAYRIELESSAVHDAELGRLRWVGQVDRRFLRDLYAAADVLALPSVWPEPAPMVAVEAMAQGCPIVGSRIGGIPFIVPDGEAGILVPPNDSSSLASALNLLLNDRDLWHRLSDGAARRAREWHSLERLAAEHISLYESLPPLRPRDHAGQGRTPPAATRI